MVKKYRMMLNSDHSCGDSTFGKKDIRRSTGSTSGKLGERIQVMLKSHCSLADGMAIDLYQHSFRLMFSMYDAVEFQNL